MELPTKYDTTTRIPDDRIEKVLGRTIYRLTACVPEYGLKEGNILMWREKGGFYVIYQFLDDAIHACFATHCTYGFGSAADEGELAVLDRFVAESNDMVYLLLDWKAMTPPERLQYELDCLEMVESLGKVIDEDKVKIKTWMAQAASVIDSKGRENIGRTRALQSSQAQVGDRRIGNVICISELVDRRKAALLRERETNLSALRKACVLLEKISRDMQTIQSARHGLMERLSQVPPILMETHDRPWRRAFRHSADDVLSAINLLNQGKMDEARHQVTIAHVALRGLKEIHQPLSDYRLKLAMALERRPRRENELEYLFGELIRARRLLNPNEHPGDPLFKTKLCQRIAGELDSAIAEWNRGSFTDVRKHLSATADGA